MNCTMSNRRLWTPHIFTSFVSVSNSAFPSFTCVYRYQLQRIWPDSTADCAPCFLNSDNTSTWSFLHRLFTEADFSATSNLVLMPQINNWVTSIKSVDSSKDTENHSKSFALFLNWLLILLQMSSTLKSTVLAKNLIV